MAAQLVSPYQQHYPAWEHNQQSPYDQSQMLPINMYSLEPSLQTPYELPTQPSHQRHQQRRSQSAPWTAQEDDRLLKSKRQGLQWDVIQKKYFPDKSTGNACRKRYERLENKRRATDWDEPRLQSLAVAYMDMRQEIWGPLAKKLGERWDHVEKKVIEEGVKNLTNKASHSRNVSSGSSRSHRSGYDQEHSSPHDDYDQEKQPEDEDEDSGIGLGVGSGSRRASRRVSGQDDSNTLDPGSLHHMLQPGLYHQ